MSRVVIITGASSGIGLETALLLSQKGYRVYGISRKYYFNEHFTHISCDVTDTEKMGNIFRDIYDKEGEIYALINNAGIGISGAIEYANKEEVQKIFDINIIGVVNLSSKIIPYLRESKGKIINISSVAGEIPIPFQACYSATKSAVESFSMALYNELKPQKVKVCCIRPGDTKTGFTKNRLKTEIVNNVYGQRIVKSVRKMESDEQNGTKPIKIAKTIFKCLKRKNPPIICTVGFVYKIFCILSKFLPKKLVNFIVYKIYWLVLIKKTRIRSVPFETCKIFNLKRTKSK